MIVLNTLNTRGSHFTAREAKMWLMTVSDAKSEDFNLLVSMNEKRLSHKKQQPLIPGVTVLVEL